MQQGDFRLCPGQALHFLPSSGHLHGLIIILLYLSYVHHKSLCAFWYHVAQAGLEIPMSPRMTLISWLSCLQFLGAGITGTCTVTCFMQRWESNPGLCAWWASVLTTELLPQPGDPPFKAVPERSQAFKRPPAERLLWSQQNCCEDSQKKTLSCPKAGDGSHWPLFGAFFEKRKVWGVGRIWEGTLVQITWDWFETFSESRKPICSFSHFYWFQALPWGWTFKNLR